MDSKIICNYEDIQFLNDAIFDTLEKKNKKKNIIWKLLYRATIDGSTPSDFHKKVDNKGPTLSIIKTKKGFIFGAFTNISYTSENVSKYTSENVSKYKSENESKDDPKHSFVFSINLKKIYKSTCNGIKNLGCFRDCGVCTWGSIYTKGNFINENKSCTFNKSLFSYYYENCERDYELNNGEEYFSMNELEVFEIEFD